MKTTGLVENECGKNVVLEEVMKRNPRIGIVIKRM
jgi:hypothetical protein